MGRRDISIVINVCSAGSLTVKGQVCRGGGGCIGDTLEAAVAGGQTMGWEWGWAI